MVLWILPLSLDFHVRGFHPLWPAFPKPFHYSQESLLQSEPQCARTLVWALPISLAATLEIDVSFFSSGYLDVSVHRVPLHTLWIGVWIHEVFSCGFPHSEISGSLDICSSPKLFAAYHVFHRLLVPRHPLRSFQHNQFYKNACYKNGITKGSALRYVFFDRRFYPHA